MTPRKGGAAPALTGTTPVTQPSANSHEGSRHVYDTPNGKRFPATGTNSRHPRRLTLCDVLVWTIVTIAAAGLMYALCGLVTLAWPL